MWKLQFAKPVFGKYSELELIVQVQILCIKISVITGWALPTNETLLDELYVQFSKKLVEDYFSLNADEIEYAFRKYGTTVEDWGKSFNLNLVDKVLLKYLSYRTDIREFVEKIKTDEEPKQLPDMQQSDEDFIEECFQMWCGLKNKFYQYINHRVYDKLLDRGLISLSEEDKIRIRAAVKADNRAMKQNNRFEELCHRLKEIKDAPDDHFMNRLCKKYAVSEYFNQLIEQGKEKVL